MSETSFRHKDKAPAIVGFAVVVCSSSRYRKFMTKKQVEDPSGDLIAKLLRQHGHKVVLKAIVPDDKVLIGQAVSKALNSRRIDAVITCGGTGVSPKDVTIETVEPLFDKVLPGFGEAFRRISFERIGSATILSRATAGVVGRKAVFCVPGSPEAVKVCVEKLILPEAGHILKHAREK